VSISTAEILKSFADTNVNNTPEYDTSKSISKLPQGQGGGEGGREGVLCKHACVVKEKSVGG